MKKKKLRPVGEIMFDVEDVLNELCVDHDMQWHEVLGLVHASLRVHFPESRETYMDDTHPEFWYGQKQKK